MSKFCSICRNTDCNNHGKNITFYGDDWECKYIPVTTNADRIRSMSDEELAEWVVSFVVDQFEKATAKTHHKAILEKNANSDMLKWLQQPAEEDDHEND